MSYFLQATKAMQKKRRRLKVLQYLALFLVVTVVVAAATTYYWLKQLESKMQLKPEEAQKLNKVVTKPQANIWNLLLVGTDKRPGWQSSRADTIIFASLNFDTKKAYLLSIPRDSRVAIPGRGLDKINHAWAFGKAPLLIKTVQNFLGLPVNYFLQLDFASFEKTVDAIGGVDFAVSQGWYDGELGVEVRSGLKHRYGKEALALVRSRKFAAGDFSRIQHQQQFLQAVAQQVLANYSDIPHIANIVASYAATNMSLGEMLKVGQNFRNSGFKLQMATVPGKPGMLNGVSYVFPDLAKKEALVKAVKEGKDLPTAP